jgi:hypothetical protein
MAIPGQASGDFTESSSALRILYVGHRNSFAADLTLDAFTQTNPPVVVTANTISATLSPAPKRGVLGASVAFTRPDAGNGFIGGPVSAPPAAGAVRPLGLFINDAAGNAYENLPGVASGKGPYVSSQGTMGARLFETQNMTGGTDLVYAQGDALVASVNGYLTNVQNAANTFELSANYSAGGAAAAATVLGVVTIVPDAVHNEILFDLRV